MKISGKTLSKLRRELAILRKPLVGRNDLDGIRAITRARKILATLKPSRRYEDIY